MEKFKPYIHLTKEKVSTPPDYLKFKVYYKFELDKDQYVQRMKHTPIASGREMRVVEFEFKKVVGGNDLVPRDGAFEIKSSQITWPETKVKVVLVDLDHPHPAAGHTGSSTGHYGDPD
ncbi:MAG: hypothetical protein RIM99_10095 [Cyclobacteriaceae bacterium]